MIGLCCQSSNHWFVIIGMCITIRYINWKLQLKHNAFRSRRENNKNDEKKNPTFLLLTQLRHRQQPVWLHFVSQMIRNMFAVLWFAVLISHREREFNSKCGHRAWQMRTAVQNAHIGDGCLSPISLCKASRGQRKTPTMYPCWSTAVVVELYPRQGFWAWVVSIAILVDLVCLLSSMQHTMFVLPNCFKSGNPGNRRIQTKTKTDVAARTREPTGGCSIKNQ